MGRAAGRAGASALGPVLSAAAILLVGLTGSLSAQDLRGGYFVHEFWAELQPMAEGLQPDFAPNGGASAGPAANQPTPRERAITDILKEAQYVFSGMIYGFSFTYVPADPTRGVAGSFELVPIAQIKWGDPHLKVLDTRVEGSRLVARVMYSLVPYQRAWTEGWDSNVFPTATGRGESRYFLSYTEKLASYEEAIKEAIRGYLSQRIYNRPRRIIGQLVLRDNPYTIIDAGRYVTTLKVKLRIDKVEPYTVF